MATDVKEALVFIERKLESIEKKVEAIADDVNEMREDIPTNLDEDLSEIKSLLVQIV
jgi:archaellum component FlaC